MLPAWLVVGLGLGAAASVVVAGVFVLGDRLFPATPADDATRLDGTARRRREIREYLLAVDERFLEDREVGGESVAFYLPERGVAITFDAQAYFRLDRRGITAVLCEHEMPGRHLGRRLPFEVAEPDVAAFGAPVDDPVRAAYAELDLRVGADSDAVTAAYRDRVKEVHPDHGGDAEAFRRLREAYTTARDHAATADAATA